MEIPKIDNINNNIENDSLISMLNEATEIKEKTIDIEHQEIFNKNDFDLSKIEKIDVEKKEEVKEIKNPIDYKAQAEMLIITFDGIQSMALPYFYEKSIFSKDEKEKLKKWKNNGKPDILNDEEKYLLHKNNDHIDAVNNLPFSDKEIETLRNPLANILEKYNYKTSAEMLLIGTLFAVMAPRLMPLFSNFDKKIKL